MRGNLIEVYKIMRGIDRVDSQRLFPRAEMAMMRVHDYKVIGEMYKGDVRGIYFMQRVVGAWNALPALVVDSDMLGTFKRLLDRHMDASALTGL